MKGHRDIGAAIALIGAALSLYAFLNRRQVNEAIAKEKAETKRTLARIEKTLGAVSAKLSG
jgi:uncharacterized membrane protein YidH (DUF202 family)